jgi:hypothetical protein
MRVTMSNSSRAKLITFAPFLSIVNQVDDTLCIREWHRNERQVSKFDWIVIDTNAEIEKVCFFY